MEVFNYVMVLISIITGLAITQLLGGVAQLIQEPGRVKIYWVQLVWAASNFLWVLAWWWFEFGLSRQQWSFKLYLFVICYAVIVYLRCAITFPPPGAGYEDLREYYYSRRGYAYGLVILQILIDVVDTLLKGWSHLIALGPMYWIGMPILTLAAAIAMKTRNPIYHAFGVLVYLAYGVVFDVTVFNAVQ